MTQGCRWQEKSFSVLVNEQKEFDKCSKCGTLTDGHLKQNHKIVCRECWDKIPSLNIEGNFSTPKDKLYDFYSISLGMKINSKTEWKKELKKRGLTDDFNQSWSGRKRDIEKRASNQHTNRVHRHESIKDGVREALKSMNMYSKDKLFIPKSKAPTRMIYG